MSRSCSSLRSSPPTLRSTRHPTNLQDARKVLTTSPVLTLRGGSLSPSVTNAVVGLNVASGLFSYISPAKNLEAYGSSGAATVDQTAVSEERSVGG